MSKKLIKRFDLVFLFYFDSKYFFMFIFPLYNLSSKYYYQCFLVNHRWLSCLTCKYNAIILVQEVCSLQTTKSNIYDLYGYKYNTYLVVEFNHWFIWYSSTVFYLFFYAHILTSNNDLTFHILMNIIAVFNILEFLPITYKL